MASAVPSLLFCLLLLAPHFGSSASYTTYIHGGKPVVLSSPEPAAQSPKTSCSSVLSGRADGALPVMHRQSPCSPLGASLSQGQPTTGEVLHRDALRLRSLFGEDDSTAGGDATVPAIGTPITTYPGASDYHVVVGFGTPERKLPMAFDTAFNGLNLLKCKPCAAGAPCRHVFDPSRSSSVAPVPCDSSDCPLKGGCTTPDCAFSVGIRNVTLFNGTFLTDKLTLSPSTAVESFRFLCLELGSGKKTDEASGVLDLSRESHSLASRSPPSLFTVAFSYCLPWALGSRGFLSIGGLRPEFSGHKVVYTPLRKNPLHPNLYFVGLTAISIYEKDISVDPAALAGDSALELHTTFTYLRPAIYAALSDEFNQHMTAYPRAPPQGDLAACYNFTGLPIFGMPGITLKFDGEATIDLGFEEMLYFNDRSSGSGVSSVGCLAFAPAPPSKTDLVAVIGSFVQTSTEVVYDVAGGKLGFISDRC